MFFVVLTSLRSQGVWKNSRSPHKQIMVQFWGTGITFVVCTLGSWNLWFDPQFLERVHTESTGQVSPKPLVSMHSLGQGEWWPGCSGTSPSQSDCISPVLKKNSSTRHMQDKHSMFDSDQSTITFFKNLKWLKIIHLIDTSHPQMTNLTPQNVKTVTQKYN